MKRIVAAPKYKWDFSHLYPDLEAWKADLAQLKKLLPQFEAFKGHLDVEKVFLTYLDLDQTLNLLINKLSQYLHLGDVDTTNQVFQALESQLVSEIQKFSMATAFIAPELKSIGLEKLTSFLAKTSSHQKYQYGLEKFFREAEHILDHHDEALLSRVERSRSHSARLYDTLAYADRQEPLITYQGQQQPLTTALMMTIAEDSDPHQDQKLRHEAALLFGKNFHDHKHSFASIYEGILLEEVETMHLRHYPSTLVSSLTGDAISPLVYQKLLEVGQKTAYLFRDYHQFLKTHFGLPKFYATDRQLKIAQQAPKTFTVEAAQTLIREALSVLGNEYLDQLTVAWSDHQIDYYEAPNKLDGAYSSGGGGLKPIILMNWDDKLNSVHTLAHESGHSVHTLFADHYQPYPLSNYPIVLAEVASTINEHLLFDHLYRQATDDQEKIYFLQQRIFDLLSTFTRQIQFAAFEYEAHQLVEKEQPITADVLAQLFLKIQNDYGYDVFDQPENDPLPFGWSRISHFFHSPFYVYKYALDLVASFKLYQDVKTGNIKTTLDFLKAGGHKDPLKILADVGVDFQQATAYEPLIKGIENYLQELKTLVQKTKLSQLAKV